jgi:hypothetical protein
MEAQAFDLVLSATAFHWIAPEIGYPKAAQALKDSGYLAIFSNEHLKPRTPFFTEAQQVYRRIIPEWTDPPTDPASPAAIQATAAYMDGTGLFEPVVVQTYPWTQDYTATEYIKLLNTYSNHRALEPSRREQLYAGIRTLIEDKYNGTLTKQYLAVLYLAQKRQVR